MRETFAQEKAKRKSLELELVTAKAASKQEEDLEIKELKTPKLSRYRSVEGAAPRAPRSLGVSDISFSSGFTTSTASGRSPYFEH